MFFLLLHEQFNPFLFPITSESPYLCAGKNFPVNSIPTSLGSCRGNVSMVYVLLRFLSNYNLEAAFPPAVQGVPCFGRCQLSK